MLTLNIDEFMIELQDGALKNVGPSNKSAEAKLFDVDSAEAREFGDKRVKCVFADDEGNEIEVALFPDDASRLARDIKALEESSPVFE